MAGAPQQGTGKPGDAKGMMPKQFNMPLACYHWARGGSVYSDEEC